MTKFELIKECMNNIDVRNCIVYKGFIVKGSEEDNSQTSECTLAVFWKDRDGIKSVSCLPFNNYLNLAEGSALSKVVSINDEYFDAVQFDEDYSKTRLLIKKDKELVKYEIDRKIIDPESLELPKEELDFIKSLTAESKDVTFARIECSAMSDALNHIILS